MNLKASIDALRSGTSCTPRPACASARRHCNDVSLRRTAAAGQAGPLDVKRSKSKHSRQERYDVFRSQFGHYFPRPLPEAIGYCQFAYFDADWTPRLLGERGALLPDGDGERARALRCLAREFKITWGPVWARIVVYSAAFFGVLAGLEALISAAG